MLALIKYISHKTQRLTRYSKWAHCPTALQVRVHIIEFNVLGRPLKVHLAHAHTYKMTPKTNNHTTKLYKIYESPATRHWLVTEFAATGDFGAGALVGERFNKTTNDTQFYLYVVGIVRFYTEPIFHGIVNELFLLTNAFEWCPIGLTIHKTPR